jgi:hypothetical protein
MRVPTRQVCSLLTTTMAFVIPGSGCGPKEPSEEVLQRYRWVMMADKEVMAYACPELQRKPLEAEDPLRAATTFVHGGKQLEGWAEDEIDVVNKTPASLARSLDSLQISIGLMARSFVPAISTARLHEGECYGQFALNCNKLIRGREVIMNIDGFMMRTALKDYLRHRSALERTFEKEGAPLGALATCAESPPSSS